MTRLPKVVRDVQGVPEDAFSQLRTRFLELAPQEAFCASDQQSLRPGKRTASAVIVLSAGHLTHFLRKNNLLLGQKDANDLSVYLDEELPARFDEPLVKPALPGSITAARETKRSVVIGNCPELIDERDIAQSLVERFFEVKKAPENWPPHTMPWGYELALTNNTRLDDIANLALRSLDNIKTFQDLHITYKAASIDIVPVGNISSNICS